MTILKDSPFQLKGSMFTLTVMHLHNPSPETLDQHLQKLTRESPRLFANMPIVIDLEQLDPNSHLDFVHIDRLLRQHGLTPVGVRHANEQQQQAANQIGLAVLNQKPKAKTNDMTSKKAQINPVTRPKIISQPVRSGQQIYAKGTDLIILASVSAGSEIIADGHIHVYGTIRGRVLAGVQGDTNARIICSALAPELISIAGRYQTQDQFNAPTGKGPFQVYLAENQLECSAI